MIECKIIRLFDIFLSSIALFILGPLLIFVCIFLKFSGEGEIFYLQKRIGKNYKKFNIFKFATMMKDSPLLASGTVTLKDDPRVLPTGKILRKTKVNELPQLINILKGDMSFIGPRPQTQNCFEAFPKNYQNLIVKMKPGLSGIGSVIFRGEENMLFDQTESLNFYQNVIGPYKGEVESWYLERHGLINYFILIILTVLCVLFSKNSLIWRIFKSLPRPPDTLQKYLNYPY